MKPRGCNRWQSAANRLALETAKNGKEGVDGSSPSEGSAKPPQIRAFVLDE
jgi:hypothetical protein